MDKSPIVYFSLVEWDFLWSRPQQIVSRLARNRKVLYLEVHGVRNLARDFHMPDDLFRIGRKLGRWGRSIFSGPRRVDESLWVLAPIMPPATGHPMVSNLGHRVLRGAIRRCQRQLGLENPVLLYTIPRPELLSLIGQLDEKAVIYDCMDDYGDFPSTHPDFPLWEEQMLREADAVTVSSMALQEKKTRGERRPFLIPNGAEFEHFHAAQTAALAEPAELKDRPHPRILYFGVINDWFDVEIMQHCISSRHDWTFVLMGIDVIDLAASMTQPNVLFPGRQPYSDLPAWLTHCDACIIPFRITPLTIATNPIKLFEYCAAGKPVVSTPLPEVSVFNDIVSIAATPGDFLSALDQAVTAHEGDVVERRVAFARGHSWDGRAKAMEDVIEEVTE